MIICHCLAISDGEIHDAVAQIRAADPEARITPGRVYLALGKRSDCGGCLPLFMDTLERGSVPRLGSRRDDLPRELRGLTATAI